MSSPTTATATRGGEVLGVPRRISSAELAAYVVNLRRRADRRARMERILPAELPVIFTSDWDRSFDWRDLGGIHLGAEGVGLFPWRIESDNAWWNRPLKLGEVGCTLAHLACWRHFADSTTAPFVLILEDDAVLDPDFLDELLNGLRRLTDLAVPFDLLYLGRQPLEPDAPALDGFVSPGYSHCTFGYLLARPAVEVALEAGLERAIVPVDEFLPALYIDHPRPDIRARFPRRLVALAFSPPLVQQLGKQEAGSDTEASSFVEQPEAAGL